MPTMKESNKMTFAKKKVEEFKVIFCDKKYGKIDDYFIKVFSDRLKQTIAEAEKEGMKKAYKKYIQEYNTYDSDITSADVFNFTKKKLKELEAKK